MGPAAPGVAPFPWGALLGRHARRILERRELLLVALGIGIVGGVILGLLAWFSGGSAGPGRLVTVGPNPWAVGGWGSLELALASMVGLLSGGRAEPRTRR